MFAHVRRGFFEALDQSPKQAGWVLLQMGHLYGIERKLRCQGAGAELRQADRASQSRMIYARIHRVLERWQRSGRILPQSSFGKAISYALGQWESLEVYLKDGTIEIDNNLVENAIRPTALGKNYEKLRIRQSWTQARQVHHWQALKPAGNCSNRLLFILKHYQ